MHRRTPLKGAQGQKQACDANAQVPCPQTTDKQHAACSAAGGAKNAAPPPTVRAAPQPRRSMSLAWLSLAAACMSVLLLPPILHNLIVYAWLTLRYVAAPQVGETKGNIVPCPAFVRASTRQVHADTTHSDEAPESEGVD